MKEYARKIMPGYLSGVFNLFDGSVSMIRLMGISNLYLEEKEMRQKLTKTRPMAATSVIKVMS